jgi:hypothetical protein
MRWDLWQLPSSLRRAARDNLEAKNQRVRKKEGEEDLTLVLRLDQAQKFSLIPTWN